MKNIPKEELLKFAIRYDAGIQIKKSWKSFGIEGTEQIIREVYELMPTLRDYMLEVHSTLLKEESNG